MATLVRRMIVPRGESLLASRHSSTLHTPLSGYNPAHPMHARRVRVSLVRVGLAAALTLIAAAAVRAQQQPTSGIGTVVSASPMYLTPDTSRTPLTTLQPGARVRVLTLEGDWYRVIFSDAYLGERTGYVLAATIRIEPPGAPVAP